MKIRKKQDLDRKVSKLPILNIIQSAGKCQQFKKKLLRRTTN